MKNGAEGWETVRVQCLGQTGFRFEYAGTAVYIDPYLSNSVQEKEDRSMVRLFPVPVAPDRISDADWVLVTHEHRDHCDIDSIVPIASASQNCRFLGPPNATKILRDGGIDEGRIQIARCSEVVSLGANLDVHPVPSAHPTVECDAEGMCRWLGYVFRFGNRFVYHAGDTSVDDEVVSVLRDFGKIDVAFLPVNEKNFYRERRGIVGNMSVREAFQFAEGIHADAIVPTHWDMFEENSVFEEEIQLLYRKLAPQFELIMDPKLI